MKELALLLVVLSVLGRPALACVWKVDVINNETNEIKTYLPKPFGEYLTIDMPIKRSSWTYCVVVQEKFEIKGVGGTELMISCEATGGAIAEVSCSELRTARDSCRLKLARIIDPLKPMPNIAIHGRCEN